MRKHTLCINYQEKLWLPVRICYFSLLDIKNYYYYYLKYGIWTQDLYLDPLYQYIFFCDEFFQERFSKTICLGWLWAVVILISASWVAKIAGVSHWCLAWILRIMKLSLISAYIRVPFVPFPWKGSRFDTPVYIYSFCDTIEVILKFSFIPFSSHLLILNYF
jgi:hypothetical protein